MAVSELNAWVSEADYPSNGLSLAASAGNNRVGILILTGEIQNDGGGAVGVASITWGGRTCTEIFQENCGDPGAYNDVVAIWYLEESEIDQMSGSAITVTWENFNGNGSFGTGGIGPFGNGKVAAAFFQDVDQANIVSATNSNTTGATSATADNIDMGVIDTDLDEQVIVGAVSGQGSTSDDYDAETGYTIELQLVGATNDHTICVFTRDSQANDNALNTNFNVGSVNRLSIGSVSLGAAAGGEISLLPVQALSIAGFVPQAVTTEHHISNLPVQALSIAGFVPQLVTFDPNTSTLPVQALSVAGFAPQAVTTENRFSNLPVQALSIAAFVPQAVTTENRFSNLPVQAISLAVFVPQFVTFDPNTSQLPLQALTVTGFAPQVVSTENHFINLPLQAINLGAFVPQFVTFDPNTSNLPLQALTITAYVPQFVVPEVCDELLAPDVLLQQVNLTGAVTDIDEPTASPDGLWLVSP